jgi:hypothetical protein
MFKSPERGFGRELSPKRKQEIAELHKIKETEAGEEKEESKHKNGLGKKIKKWLGIAGAVGLGGLAIDANMEKNMIDAVTGAAEKAKKVEQKAPVDKIKKERAKEQKKIEEKFDLSQTGIVSEKAPEAEPWDGYKKAKAEFNKEIANSSIEDLLTVHEGGAPVIANKYLHFFSTDSQLESSDYNFNAFLTKVAGRETYLDEARKKIEAGIRAKDGSIDKAFLDKIAKRVKETNEKAKENHEEKKYSTDFVFLLKSLSRDLQ